MTKPQHENVKSPWQKYAENNLGDHKMDRSHLAMDPVYLCIPLVTHDIYFSYRIHMVWFKHVQLVAEIG